MNSQHNDVEDQLARLRRGLTPVAFRTGFADRVMARLDGASARPSTPSLGDGLQRVFVRLAPLAAAAVLVVAALNVRSAASSEQPLVDRVLGLPSVSLDSAYSLDGVFAYWADSEGRP